MSIIKNPFVLDSSHNNRKFLCDVRYISNEQKKPIIIFVHGFKGFKDWGHFNLLADKFAAEGFVYVKLNFSHNGTTPGHPMDFADLDAFGNNNYTIELDDIKVLLDHLESSDFLVPSMEIALDQIALIGHSRGGGVAIIKAAEDDRIRRLVTWASVSKFATMSTNDTLEEWKEKGVTYIYNSRTKQNMPLYYQLMENFLGDQTRFSILENVKKLNIPYLNIHGDNDETVNVSSVDEMKASNGDISSYIVEGANHVFGVTHPYENEELPNHAQEMFDQTLKFLKE